MNIVVTLLFWALALFFLYGARNNWLARGNLRETYRRWGYPDGFHHVTAVLEGVAAILLLVPGTRIVGALLACGVMLAAIGTLLKAGLFRQTMTPGIILALCGLGIAVA